MDKKEFEEIRRKAEQGDAEEQFNLGNCYYDGYGVEQDYEEAVKWYRMVAEQGDDRAQYFLGACYEVGEGVEQDFEEAKKWYQLAAEQGNEDAKVTLKLLF